MKGTIAEKQFLRAGNIGKQDFDIGEQSDLFQGNKGTGIPLGGPHGCVCVGGGGSLCWPSTCVSTFCICTFFY